MNTIDIVILAILAFACYRGMREGIIIQILSLLGIGIGIWLGLSIGSNIASMLGIGGNYTSVWGFVIVLLLTIIASAILARILRKIIKFAGIGFIDIILGALLSMAKYVIVISMFLAAFDTINQSLPLVKHKHIEASKLYRPISNISDDWLAPSWEWAQKQLESEAQKSVKDIDKSVKQIKKMID